MPLATEVLSGEQADDPVYLPIIARVRDGLKLQGLLYVGDCKLAALQTRTSLAAQGDFYLCPLSAVQAPPEQVSQEVETLRKQGVSVIEVCRLDEQGSSICIAQGYETIHSMTAEVDGAAFRWQERRLLVQSLAAAQAAQASLQERLQKAQQALAELTLRRQGKPRLREHAEVEEAIKAVLKQFRVEGLLQVQIQEHVHERPVRAYRGRLSGVRRDLTFTLTSAREETAIARAMSHLGWRVYATNEPGEQLTVEQAVEAYRDEYLVERCFARLKGRPLSLAPL